ncbi:cubilin homolog [Mercenaria mercenaria]|uniref:cubilin homolog n=1 Tax=Mercenaria mercenaria TaxID=6596 RepID=UPI00234F0874|nr:cubilin homolog [Mercenaria mercenaria]
MYRPLVLSALCFIGLTAGVIKGDVDCSSKIRPTETRPCPAGLRDDGISCWKDSYGRGVGRVPDKSPCDDGQRDDGTSCWIDSYGRGVGRTADKAPCPSGLRDDGTSCWNDAHIYGKGCCCTLWGCCDKCPVGYHDDGCTCRKTNVGIVRTLFQRLSCNSTEDKYGSRCYPKCAPGYSPVGCCICEPDGGPGIVQTLAKRQSCHENETMHGGLCYPKCKGGYRSMGCCVCEPEEGPGIKLTHPARQHCTGNAMKFNGVCVDIEECSASDLARELQKKTKMTSSQIEQFKKKVAAEKVGK